MFPRLLSENYIFTIQTMLWILRKLIYKNKDAKAIGKKYSDRKMRLFVLDSVSNQQWVN